MIVDIFPAMGTTFEAHTATGVEAVAIRHRVARFEQRFSRFLATSELSQINSSEGSWHAVSEPMSRVLDAAAMVKDRTGGLVDIGVGAAVVSWGYTVPFDDLPSSVALGSLVSATGWQACDGTVRLDGRTKLDLGGIAKGWACDEIVESGMAQMVSAGGDLRSSDPDVIVEVVDHFNNPIADIHVGRGALATSSTMKRRWTTDVGGANHLIDPRTMRPVKSPITQATVVAETAVEAEAGAKAVLLQGVDGLAWADRQPWIRQAVAVWHDGSVYATKDRQAA
ncbi:MAG: FAD:protein FMN transferase [Armatimonadetes bacterium]|nr:MAG: FAD:protein FMN transferase [Armatimonadota bacterium]